MSPFRNVFRSTLWSLAVLAGGLGPSARAAMTNVSVVDFAFSPATVAIKPNDSVKWSWTGNNHSTTSTTGLWNSGVHNAGFIFTNTFANSGTFPYMCTVHTFMTGSVIVSNAANQLPTVTITNPPNNSVFNAPASFTLAASASDPDGTVSQVEFFRGATSLGADTTSPYSVPVNNLAAGTYTFSAVATDNASGKTTNSIIVIANALPTVSITNPVSGATFAAPWTGAIQATASDSDGSVTNVQFFRDSTSLGNVASPPFSVTVTNVAAGTYTLSAVAKDNRGATNTSAGVTVSVVTPASVVLVNPERLSATQFRITYSANAGLRYVVERSASLTSINFVGLNTNIAAGSSVTFTDSTATASQNFYRVGRLPNP